MMQDVLNKAAYPMCQRSGETHTHVHTREQEEAQQEGKDHLSLAPC